MSYFADYLACTPAIYLRYELLRSAINRHRGWGWRPVIDDTAPLPHLPGTSPDGDVDTAPTRQGHRPRVTATSCVITSLGRADFMS